MRKLAEEAETLCRTIAPKDLAGWPLYIALQTKTPIFQGFHSLGFTTPALDLYLRSSLGNRWHGRGPAMLLSDSTLQREFAASLQTTFLGLVLHELAHVLERDPIIGEQVRPWITVPEETAAMAEVASRPRSQDIPPLYGHGINFARVLGHLFHRVRALGIPVMPSQLFAPYDLLTWLALIDATREEAATNPNQTFRVLLQSPPPQALVDAWEPFASPNLGVFPNE